MNIIYMFQLLTIPSSPFGLQYIVSKKYENLPVLS